MGESLWILSKDMLDYTPSRNDGIPAELEQSYRFKGCCLIEDIGQRTTMKINPRLIISSSCVLFHRFYAFQSFKSHDLNVMAIACLFLACKIEENLIKLEALISTYLKYLVSKSIVVDEKDASELREKVIIGERILLHTLGFELQLQHPYHPCAQCIRELKAYLPDDRKKEAHQLSVNFINDSFKVTLCLQYPPNEIATAAVFLALLGMDIEPLKSVQPQPVQPNASSTKPSPSPEASFAWFELIKEQSRISEDHLKDICKQIMDILNTHKHKASKKDLVQIKAIDKALMPIVHSRSSASAPAVAEKQPLQPSKAMEGEDSNRTDQPSIPMEVNGMSESNRAGGESTLEESKIFPDSSTVVSAGKEVVITAASATLGSECTSVSGRGSATEADSGVAGTVRRDREESDDTNTDLPSKRMKTS